MGKYKDFYIVKGECPKCNEYFADIKMAFGKMLDTKDIKFRGKWKNTKVRKNSDLKCPQCKYIFMFFDIMVLLEKTVEKEERNTKITSRRKIPT